jgi:hypothetical protein
MIRTPIKWATSLPTKLNRSKNMTEDTETKEAEKRYSIIVGKEVQERLASIAKEYKISQTDVVLTLVENTDLEAMAPKFKAKREDKVKSRGSKSAVLERLKGLSPEQLEKLLANL